LRIIGGPARRLLPRRRQAPATQRRPRSGVGKDHDGVLSPKIDVAYELTDHIELYADWGAASTPTTVRGAFATPAVPILVKGTGKELGARIQLGHLTLNDHLLEAGCWERAALCGRLQRRRADRGQQAARDRDRRVLEAAALAGLGRQLHRRPRALRQRRPHPNAFENAAAAGISIVKDGWEGSIRLRHLGPYPLIEDNSQRDHGSNVVNLRAARKFEHIEVYGDILNVLNSKDKDITYFYESFIPGFDAAPVEDRLSRTVEPRTVRVGATYRF
jgi:hypothetical protein